MSSNPIIVEAATTTAYGAGIDLCWQGLLDNQSAIAEHDWPGCHQFQSDLAALVPKPAQAPEQRSRLTAILAPTLASMRTVIPPQSSLLLATTLGEVDLLEQNLVNHGDDPAAGQPLHLLPWLREQTGVRGPASLVSAACASSAVALIRARQMIEQGVSESVLVVACDTVSEFVLAGFSTLMALSPDRARPYDRQRNGLTLGEATAAALVMAPELARRQGRKGLASVVGCGMVADANHMTGPCRQGRGLRRAIETALAEAKIKPEEIAFICGHGTGTVYNDAMEIEAFSSVFGPAFPPLFSIKGGTGHTLGSAGLLEVLLTSRGLQCRTVPPSIGLSQPEPKAQDSVGQQAREVPGAEFALSTNSGFGGLNSALILARHP